MGPNIALSGQTWPDRGQMCSNFGQMWPKCVGADHPKHEILAVTDLGENGQIRYGPKWAQMWPYRAKRGPVGAKGGRISAKRSPNVWARSTQNMKFWL